MLPCPVLSTTIETFAAHPYYTDYIRTWSLHLK